MSKGLKYPPCEHCGGRMKSKGAGRIFCVKCRKTVTKPTPVDQIPNDHFVKGVSTLIDAQGNTKQQWIKTQKEAEQKEEALKRLLSEIPELVPERVSVSPRPAEILRSDLLSVYPCGDPHIGMLSWAEETGADFDVKIARNQLEKAMTYLVQQGDPTKDALIINCGDFFHSDNNAAVTPQSGNALDTDSRWAKILRVGLATMVSMIEIALARHAHVNVISEIGNHDIHSSTFLQIALDAYYRNEPRVHVDMSPAKFHYFRFGKCFIGTTHGDTVKPQDLPSIMACDQAQEWGTSTYRYWYTGHVHHSRIHEFRGCTVETFRTLAPKDSWHVAKGYRSGSDMVKIMLHNEYGEIFRSTCDARFVNAK